MLHWPSAPCSPAVELQLPNRSPVAATSGAHVKRQSGGDTTDHTPNEHAALPFTGDDAPVAQPSAQVLPDAHSADDEQLPNVVSAGTDTDDGRTEAGQGEAEQARDSKQAST
jgi:hypothetical protein